MLQQAKGNIPKLSDLSIHINPKTGDIEASFKKEVVEEVLVSDAEISLQEARKIQYDVEIGEFIRIFLEPGRLGRIAAQKARQIISQKLKSAERDVICEEYRHRVNEIVSGTTKKIDRNANIIVDLGKVEALLPASQYPQTEKYHIGEKNISSFIRGT